MALQNMTSGGLSFGAEAGSVPDSSYVIPTEYFQILFKAATPTNPTTTPAVLGSDKTLFVKLDRLYMIGEPIVAYNTTTSKYYLATITSKTSASSSLQLMLYLTSKTEYTVTIDTTPDSSLAPYVFLPLVATTRFLTEKATDSVSTDPGTWTTYLNATTVYSYALKVQAS